MRILTVRLDYIYDNSTMEVDEAAVVQKAAEKRRDTLSNIGFDTRLMNDEQIRSYPMLGMTDEQFVELTIAGEKNMEVIAVNVLDL